MMPTAPQVAIALVVACRNMGLDPEHVFTLGNHNARARTVAGLGLVEAGLGYRATTARALRFAGGTALAPSRRLDLHIRQAESKAVADALRAHGFSPAQAEPAPKMPKWTEAEEAVIREAITRRWHDSITVTKLPGRTIDAVKKRRMILSRKPATASAAVVAAKPAPPAPSPVVPIRPAPEPRVQVGPRAPTPAPQHAPQSGALTAHQFPACIPRARADSVSLADRIFARLRRDGPMTAGVLAFMCDAKELAVSQALAMLQHDGWAEASPLPEAGRRAQKWWLTAKAVAS